MNENKITAQTMANEIKGIKNVKVFPEPVNAVY
jgi:hypothetical protein